MFNAPSIAPLACWFAQQKFALHATVLAQMELLQAKIGNIYHWSKVAIDFDPSLCLVYYFAVHMVD